MNTEHVLLDIIRFVFFLTSASIVGLSMTVASSYAARYLRHRRACRRGEESQWRGLLPLHVVLIATSHLILVMMSVFEVASRLDWHTIYWRTPVLAFANVLGAYALWVILRYSKKHSVEKVRTRLSKRD